MRPVGQPVLDTDLQTLNLDTIPNSYKQYQYERELNNHYNE